MSTEITKFQLHEKIRRLFFKYRGDINAIIKETGLDEEYIKKVTKKIRRGFQHDTSFEIACFVTDAILSGREQRLVILEDRLNELLKKKELRSVCCYAPVAEHTYENSTWYKCKKCEQHCEVEMVDNVNDAQVIKIVTSMRKEDEQIGKFLAIMGIITNTSDTPTKPVTNTSPSLEPNLLPPAEKRMLEKLENLDESKITEIKHFVESKINEAIDEPGKSG